MEKKNPKSIVKLIVYIVALAAIAGISLGTGLFKSVGDMLKGIHINLISIVQVIMMVLLVLALENLILWAVGLIKPKNPRAQTLLSIFGSIMRYITAIVIICWGLTILGANVGTIVAGVGIIALIIGFGAESLIADMVTGVFMLFENQYNVGDYIEVGGFRGKVTNIGIRTTSLEDLRTVVVGCSVSLVRSTRPFQCSTAHCWPMPGTSILVDVPRGNGEVSPKVG